MALNTNKVLKTYYSIKEVGEIFNLPEPTLRYWETEFPSLKPRTTKNKVRQYTQKDIDEIRVIYNLVKVRGFKIAAARKMLASKRDDVENTSKSLDRLLSIRSQLYDLKGALDKIV